MITPGQLAALLESEHRTPEGRDRLWKAAQLADSKCLTWLRTACTEALKLREAAGQDAGKPGAS